MSNIWGVVAVTVIVGNEDEYWGIQSVNVLWYNMRCRSIQIKNQG